MEQEGDGVVEPPRASDIPNEHSIEENAAVATEPAPAEAGEMATAEETAPPAESFEEPAAEAEIEPAPSAEDAAADSEQATEEALVPSVDEAEALVAADSEEQSEMEEETTTTELVVETAPSADAVEEPAASPGIEKSPSDAEQTEAAPVEVAKPAVESSPSGEQVVSAIDEEPAAEAELEAAPLADHEMRTAPSTEGSEAPADMEPELKAAQSAESSESLVSAEEEEPEIQPVLTSPSAESHDSRVSQEEVAEPMKASGMVDEASVPEPAAVRSPVETVQPPTPPAVAVAAVEAAQPPSPPAMAAAPVQTVLPGQMTQEEKDARLKARMARGRRGGRAGATPGVVAVSAEPSPSATQVTQNQSPTATVGVTPNNYSPRREEPPPAPMTQIERDQAMKNRLRATAPATVGVSYQPVPGAQPLQPAQSAPMTQEQKDQALKARMRSTAPAAHGASYQPTVQHVQPVQSAPMTQEQKDQALKSRMRSTAPAAHGAGYQPTPGAQPSEPSSLPQASARAGRLTRRQTQAEQDAQAKARARAGYPAEGPPVVQGAQNYGPPVVTASVEASTPGASRSATQAEQDAIAKSRARRGLPPEGPPVSSVPPAPVPVTQQSMRNTGEGLTELERRREQRAAARAERRGNRDEPIQESVTSSAPAPAQSAFSNMDEGERQRRYDAKMAQMGQSHADFREKRGVSGGNPEMVPPQETVRPQEPQALTSSTTFSGMSDAERQRRFDAKMSQMDQNHADRREKLGPTDDVNPAQEQPQTSSYSHTTPKLEELRNEELNDENTQFQPMSRQVTTTADRGVAVAPDVEYGEYTSPLVPDDDLAVAIAIDDEEEEEKFYAYAVEYDPDSKPPIYKNRRFRLYGLGGACVLLILVIVLVMGFQSEDPAPVVPLTNAPTDSPTESPTTAIELKYRSFFAKEVSDKVLLPGTPHYRAAEWIMKEDPLMLQPDDQKLLQRYMMAFLYFHTTKNGEEEWRSCNPPKEGEDDLCIFQEFNRLDNDTVTFDLRPNKVRWLSGQAVCRWEGVLCAGGSEVLGVTLFGQNLTGTLPTELAALPFLQQISLAYNMLTGTIPAEYATLRHLLSIEFHGNMLTGTIPEAFYEQDSSSLVLFNVGDNALEGTLDTRIGLMTDLKGLHVFQNNFKGSFPTEISKLNYLSFTRFNGNEFEGPLPTILGSLNQLSELWAHENLFNGTIPTQLGRLRRLQELRLWGNQMTGPIPEQIYNLNKLSRLSIREMSLTGTLSTMVGELTELVILRVSTNQLTGTIPSEIENLPRLRVAWLHLNQFEGSVPTNICNNADAGRLEFLQADCAPTIDAPNPCLCCSACCNRGTGFCLLKEDSV